MTHCNVGQYAALQWPAVSEVLCYVLAVIQMGKGRERKQKREKEKAPLQFAVATRSFEMETQNEISLSVDVDDRELSTALVNKLIGLNKLGRRATSASSPRRVPYSAQLSQTSCSI